MKSIYVNNDNQATIACPGCGREKTVDASKFMKRDGPVKIKYKFKCDHCAEKSNKRGNNTPDHTSIVVLERRKFYRKQVQLAGIFVEHRGKKGIIVVIDLSRSGLKFRLKSPWPFKLEDRISVEFNLDNTQKTFIKKESVIKKIDNMTISVEFTSAHTYSESDKEIGFYLMN
jgi:PilZ domain-containing protein